MSIGLNVHVKNSNWPHMYPFLKMKTIVDCILTCKFYLSVCFFRTTIKMINHIV